VIPREGVESLLVGRIAERFGVIPREGVESYLFHYPPSRGFSLLVIPREGVES
jgi:hypothetical protein